MSETKKFRIGVMGIRRGKTFFKMFRDQFSETCAPAVCENDETVIEEFKKEYPDVAVYTDFDEFINSGLDAVMLANNFNEHAKCAIVAMEKGIAVLSETTAAPSLGECVDLVEAQEKSGAKYMLAANGLYFPAVHAMKGELESGKYGKILYAEAEYLHGEDGAGSKDAYDLDVNNLHWRQTLPPVYYNMHSLGPLMYVTNSVPVKVSGKGIQNKEYLEERGFIKDCTSGFIRAEMDNGAIFNTTGCSGHKPTSKWYRINCQEGCLETVRYEDSETTLVIKENVFSTLNKREFWETSGVVDKEDYKPGSAEKTGHGGVDYFVGYYFVKYLKGEHEPFLDIYRSVALSAAGILAWYSALTDGRDYDVPDFKKKEDRDAVRGDYRSPFAKRLCDITLPCRLADKDKFEGYKNIR